MKKIHASNKVLVVDIEGTTTPLSFVSQTLFPYARRHLYDYLSKNWQEEDVKMWMNELFAFENTEDRSIEKAVKIAENLIDRDIKFTPLKALQGKIWRAGYEDGNLIGALFDEVETYFKKWSDSHRIYIYSSGSIEAQKLLFSHSAAGDLCVYLSGYFDTKIGSKKESQSYREIHRSIGCDLEDLHFLTDSEAEAKSAHDAKWKVILMTRPGNVPLSDTSLDTIPKCCDFEEVDKYWSL